MPVLPPCGLPRRIFFYPQLIAILGVHTIGRLCNESKAYLFS